MPPKKKGTGKSAKEKSSTVDQVPSTTEENGSTVAQGPSTAEEKSITVDQGPSKEQLEKQIIQMREELDREQKERNYFQQERDKIHDFWEISKSHLEEKYAEIRNRDKELEESAEKHQREIRKYKEKIKDMLLEHQNSIAECKHEGVVATKLLEKERADLESELQRDIHRLKVDSKEQELSYEKSIKSLKLSHDKEITKLRSEFEEKLREINATYEKKLEEQQEELDLRRKTEIHEIEKQKHAHIKKLIKSHDKAFSNIKNYYKDITYESVNQIDSLEEKVADKNSKMLEKEMPKVIQQNKRLTELLQKATQEVSELQKQLTDYQKDKSILAGKQACLKVADAELKNLIFEHELLEQRFRKVQQDRDELYKKFDKAILEVQQKRGFKNLLQEKKLVAQTETGE
ncbi:dynein regulatory complex subunit 4 [Ictalurus punctatus]|uniref:Dynein regulatory complex subunit 4 n=1 Tax=Ictalurus punctatus TaxID=7998 RepID=A0A2D0QTF2_ICTPU|nr:dynein regulatory complex subunit 4 [Ictalurus punctatus]